MNALQFRNDQLNRYQVSLSVGALHRLGAKLTVSRSGNWTADDGNSPFLKQFVFRKSSLRRQLGRWKSSPCGGAEIVIPCMRSSFKPTNSKSPSNPSTIRPLSSRKTSRTFDWGHISRLEETNQNPKTLKKRLNSSSPKSHC